MSLYLKLHAIQTAVNGLKKDKKNYSYEYVSGEKVLDYIKPIMNEQKLLLKQEVLSIDNARQDYSTKKGEVKSEILSKVMMRFTWIDAETGEKDESLFGANGQNDWDKGVGSALTYGERYFLLKYFHIATDEDDIDGLSREAPQKQTAAKQNTQQQPQKTYSVEQIKDFEERILSLIKLKSKSLNQDELASVNKVLSNRNVLKYEDAINFLSSK